MSNKNFKKGCLISIVVFIALILVISVTLLWLISRSYGLTKAPYIPIPDKIPPNSPCKITLRIEPNLEQVESIIPWDELGAKLQFPGLQTIIPWVLPYELGMWATTDLSRRIINLNIGVSEKRLGPVIYEILQSDMPWVNIKQVQWNPQGLEYPSRGYMLLQGAIPIPEGIEEILSKEWVHNDRINPMPISPNSKYLFEVSLDFQAGEIYIWASSITALLGLSLEEEKERNQYIKLGMDMAKKLKTLYAYAIPTKKDELEINIQLFANPDSRGALEFFIVGLGIPFAQDYLNNNFGIKLEGKLSWDETKNALGGKLYLKNYENFLKRKLISAI